MWSCSWSLSVTSATLPTVRPGAPLDYTGGSGFAGAFAASWLLGSGAGLVAQAGGDVDLGELERLGLDLEGVARLEGPSARFEIDQRADGTFAFGSELGVAAEPRFDLFPAGDLQARHVHLGTAPPDQQREWLKFLRDKGFRGRVSVDMFEPFTRDDPDTCRRRVRAGRSAVFLNQAEYQELFGGIRQAAGAGDRQVRGGWRGAARAGLRFRWSWRQR